MSPHYRRLVGRLRIEWRVWLLIELVQRMALSVRLSKCLHLQVFHPHVCIRLAQGKLSERVLKSLICRIRVPFGRSLMRGRPFSTTCGLRLRVSFLHYYLHKSTVPLNRGLSQSYMPCWYSSSRTISPTRVQLFATLLLSTRCDLASLVMYWRNKRPLFCRWYRINYTYF